MTAFTHPPIVATLMLATIGGVLIFSQPALAIHDSASCPPDPTLEPLFTFVHEVTTVIMILGLAFAVLGLSLSGIEYMWANTLERKKRAKQRAQNVIIGVVILLSATMIVAFLMTRLPVCS